MKRIANFLFSKLVLSGIIIVIQFGWIVYMTYYTTTINSVVNLAFHILATFLALYVVSRDMRPYFKLSWIFIILWLPIFGCPAYYMFGRSELTKHTRKRLAEMAASMEKFRKENPDTKEALRELDRDACKQSEYITKCAGYPLCREADTRYFSCGEEMFPQLLSDIRTAKHFIFLEYFILQPGKMFDTILELLEEKVKQGVLVRVIYDDVGSIKTLPPKYYRSLQKKGIHCACFNPFRPILSIIMNNRDHRKIFVIDNRIAYTGGINLADEYINEVERFGYWKDAAIRITGEGVWNFTSMFLEMWNYIIRDTEDYTKYRLPFVPEEKEKELKEERRGFVQPYGDSPLDREDVGENVYLNMIEQAREYVYIFTPYLIIGSEMATALINAAKCGVDVRIVTPGIPDKKMVFLLTQSHYEQLIRGGVKIYQYTPGFIHSKCFVSDDKYAVVGSINLDFRSLYLHFECGAFLYRASAVMEVKQDALDTFAVSRQIPLEFCENRNFIIRLLQSILHLFAPLL